MTLEDELDTSMKAQIEQSVIWNTIHDKGMANVTVRDMQSLLSLVMGVHRGAILRLAREIDGLTGIQ